MATTMMDQSVTEGNSVDKMSHSKDLAINLSFLEDSSEFDTDLENDTEDKVVLGKAKNRPKDANKAIGETTYRKACVELPTAVSTYITQHLAGTTLNLQHRNLGTKGIKALCVALKKNRTVSSLNLSDNGVGADGAVYVSAMLRENNFINQIDLSHNDLGRRGAMLMGEMLLENTGLYRINLSENNFDEDAAKYVALGLEQNYRILELDLSHNNLCEEGAMHIGRALQFNDNLAKLCISWNHIRRKGAIALFNGLGKNEALTHLDVSWNGLGYEGALALGEMLKHNTNLCELNASNCRINWQGACFIANGLKVNTTLEELMLGGNVLTTTGCMDLIMVMAEHNQTLFNLDLQDIPVIPEFEMMAAAIKQVRPFIWNHGGVVNTHDVLGQRFEKQVDPLQKVIDFMKERELRPTELFRSFDKDTMNNMTVPEFTTRIKKSGIPLHQYEVKDVLWQIGKSAGHEVDEENENYLSNINYAMLVSGVRQQVDRERRYKIKERKRQEYIKLYHKQLLTDLPPISNGEEKLSTQDSSASLSSSTDSSKSPNSSRSLHRLESISKGNVSQTNSQSPSQNELHALSGRMSTMSLKSLSVNSENQTPVKPSGIPQYISLVNPNSPSPRISMATKLGGKVKPFGRATIARPKKGRKSKKKKISLVH